MTDANQTCTACGAPLDATPIAGQCAGCLLRAGMDGPFAPAELDRLFPQLAVFELIGRGGMGAVYRARQRSLDREVALKLLPGHLVQEPGFAERFQREARALARLDHPHIVKVYDFGCTEGHSWLVMEYVDGLDLRQLMRRGALGAAEALALVPPLCDALQYAHDHGVVHRDVKPENILLDRGGRVKVADFGLAKLAGGDPGGTLTATHQVMGTPRYMAPEQVEGSHDVDHRADIYSLGVVFYEMLTGELPLGRFDAPSQRVAVDVRLDEVVLKALEKQPERRYQQAGEVKTAVEGLGATATVPDDDDEDLDAEGLLWTLLAFVAPPMAFMGVVWSRSWFPLMALFLSAAAVGSCIPSKARGSGEAAVVVVVSVFCLVAIVASMWVLKSATPLFGVLIFLWGLQVGQSQEEQRLEGESASNS